MNSLSVPVGAKGGGVQGYVSGSCLCFSKNHVFDPFRSTFTGTSGVLLKDGRGFRVRNAHRFRIYAKTRKGRKHDYPWPEDIDPNLNSGHLSYLSHFKPLAEKPKPVTLAFEKPLVDLEKKIIDVRKMAEETGLDFSDQINSLESKYQQALKDLYTHLTPIQRLNIARHPNRPTFLDHVLNITDKWVELHGDRAGYDDPAIVSGIGSIDGKSYLFIGHQKGRNTKENIHRNFGMPTPHGYRKALRMMRYADHHGFPIITFIDTPGAFADLKSEELGQGEAIAYNLRAMFGLKVPIVTVVIGEGGSGGALAIGCANKLFMLENSVFYVASPEACAAILWKTSQAAPKAAEKLKITAPELCKFKIADGIIPEPLGGAHTDPAWTSQQIKLVVMKAMEELQEMETDDLLNHRMLKFRSLGGFQEGIPVDPEKKRNMKSQDNVPATAALEAEIQNLKRKVLEAKEPSDPALNEAIEKLGEELDKELTEAFVSMGLQDKLESLKKEMAKNPNADIQPLNPGLKEKVDRLMQEFNQGLSQPGAFNELKVKLRLLTRVNRLVEQKPMGEKLKREINEKMAGEVREKLEVFKRARERLAAGERLDEDLKVSLERAKVELAGMLRSANLELVGVGKLKPPPPDLVEKMGKVREEIGREIERAVELTGLRAKLEEWKAELGKGLGKNSAQLEKIREEIAAIREQIAEAMDLTALNGKVDILTAEVGNGTGGDKNVTAEMPVEAVDGGELGGAALEEPLGDGGEQQIEEASLGWGQSEFDG